MPPRRLIRRQPLLKRIKAYLDPLDFLLWLSEELDSSDWEQWQKEWATPMGICLNVVMLVARANSGGGARRRGDDIFGDVDSSAGWMTWFAVFTVHLLSLLSFMNALYLFYRKRHYRLFESSVDIHPSTPSAHRVRVDSSPLSSSPLRFLSSMLRTDTAEARSHPDPSRDVWELSIWDPTPLSLKMFCLFSPGHVLVYWLFLPAPLSDPRPSMVVVTTLALAGLLSMQLTLLQSSFSQQSKDSSVIHKEVLNEYDTKYVHPRTQRLMRDVGTQADLAVDGSRVDRDKTNQVDTYTPAIIINRGFHTQPNPNYVQHVDPEGTRHQPTPSRSVVNERAPFFQSSATWSDTSSPLQPRTATRQSQFRSSLAADGGSLGVYSHAQSPLKKAASTHFAGGHRERERSSSPTKREGSPLKKSSVPGGLNAIAASQRWTQLQGTPVRRESDRF